MPRCQHKRGNGTDHISILTQPEGWMPRLLRLFVSLSHAISILTQPEGWMPHFSHSFQQSTITYFNPHPTRRVDATTLPSRYYSSPEHFNPHPTRRLDATSCM